MINKINTSSRFEQVFFNTGVGIMIVDKDRTLIELNPKFCEVLGYEKEELIWSVKWYNKIANKLFWYRQGNSL